jgi:Tol biopolymer transport system component
MKRHKRISLTILILLFLSLTGCSEQRVKVISRGDFVFVDYENWMFRTYHINKRSSEPFIEFEKPIQRFEISQDGKVMAVQSFKGKNNVDQNTIYIIDLEKEKIVGTIERAFLFSISPEYTIAYMSDQPSESTPQLKLMNIKSKKITTLNIDNPGQLSWSPDGKQIVYSTMSNGIYLFDVANQVARELVPSEGNDLQFYPQWSPEGDKIFFAWDQHGPFQIYCINTDGTNLQRVTHDDNDYVIPSISFDEKKILYSASDGERWGLYMSSIDGKDETLLIGGKDSRFGAAWLKAFE